MHKILSLFLLVLSLHSVMGQKTIDVDSLYYQGLDLYQSKAYESALLKANQALLLAPEYSDIRVLRVRITHRLEKWNIASKDILYLHEDGSQIEYFSLVEKQLALPENGKDVCLFLDNIAPFYPDNPDFQLAAIATYIRFQNHRAARKSLKKIERKKLTSNQKYRLRAIEKTLRSNTILLNHEALTFLADFPTQKTWNTSSLAYSHSFKQGSIGANITRSHRFIDSGTLYEIEAYPQLSPILYAHVNFNFSSENDFFQEYGAGMSLFFTTFKKLEFEAGFKYLDFDTATFFSTILGATLYSGDYYFNLRGFIGPRIENSFVQNYQITTRRYLPDSESYLFARLGTGISPEESIQFTQILNNPNLNSYFAIAGVSKWFGNSNIALSGGYQYQELTSTRKGNQLIGNIGLKYRF